MRPRNDDHPLLSLGYKVFTPDIHSSSLSLLAACPRKFLLRERFHLQPRGVYSSALELGHCFHLYMERRYSGESHEEAAAAVEWFGSDVTANLESEVDDMGLLPNGTDLTKVLRDVEMDKSKALAMATWAWNYAPWPPKDYAYATGNGLADWEVIGVEKTVRVKYAGRKTPIRGTLDLAVRRRSTREIYIVDHKTTSFDPALMMKSYTFSIQPRTYKLLAEAVYKDEGTVVGAVHNVIKKPTIRWKKNQEWEDYLEEITEWYNGTGRHEKNRALWEKSPPFVRSFIKFPRVSSDDEEYQLRLDEGDKASQAYPHLAIFPRLDTACFAFNKACPYIELCASDPQMWGSKLERGFTVGHRDDNTEVPCIMGWDDAVEHLTKGESL